MDVTKSKPMDKLPTPSQQKHRQEFLWQVLLPLFAGIVVMFLLMGLSVSAAVDQSRWADISLIWLIIPMMFFALAAIVLLGGMIYGLVKLISLLPEYTQQLQDIFVLVSLKVSNFDDRLVSPVVKLKITSAKFSKMKAQILRR